MRSVHEGTVRERKDPPPKKRKHRGVIDGFECEDSWRDATVMEGEEEGSRRVGLYTCSQGERVVDFENWARSSHVRKTWKSSKAC